MGDQIASSGELGSAVNMGGIGVAKVYRLDPYFITQPMQSIRGVTQFPSQAEIYIDGVLAGRHTVAPGSFEFKNIYSYGGAHTVEVLLKDPFGNEQRLSYPMYFSDQLLREGNHEYSYNAGFLREQFGVKSDEYGKPAFSAFHRYGVTSSLNIGARAEGSDGVYNGGLSTLFTLPRAGVFTLSLAGSSANGQRGSAGSFRYSYQLGSFNTNLQTSGFSRAYATVGAPASPDMTKFQTSLGGGFLIPVVGGVSIGYSETETYSGTNTRVTSASYSRGLTRSMSIFAAASATRTLETTYSFFIGLNFTPAKNMHGAVQYSKTGVADTETVQIQKDNPVGEGLGYRALLNRTNSGETAAYSANPSLQYNARYGVYSLDAAMQNSNDNTTESYNISAAGSVVYAGGFYGLSRPVSDSFGIVMVDSVAGAMVLNNGQEIGQTNSSGTLVVPTLASYNQNQISLDMRNMPMDYSVSGVNARLAPSLWSGSCIAFDALKVRALTGSLYAKKKDEKIPLEFVDILVKVGERVAIFPTGKGGEFFMENTFAEEPKAGAMDKQSCSAIAEHRKAGGNYIPPGGYPARVDLEDGRCVFVISFPETEDMITDIGEVECVMSGKAK
jgi:outer membrane usher protein FimD/PapC